MFENLSRLWRGNHTQPHGFTATAGSQGRRTARSVIDKRAGAIQDQRPLLQLKPAAIKCAAIAVLPASVDKLKAITRVRSLDSHDASGEKQEAEDQPLGSADERYRSGQDQLHAIFFLL